MLAPYRRWRDHRRAVKAAAEKLIADYGQRSLARARRRMAPKYLGRGVGLHRAVRYAVADQLGIEWNADTATRYVEGTVGGLGMVRR